MGSKKPPKAPKVERAKSPYDNVDRVEVSNPFASSNTQSQWETFTGANGKQQKRKAIVTTSDINPELRGLGQIAQQGAYNNLGYITQTPDEKYAALANQSDPFYEMSRMKDERLQRVQQGDAMAKASMGGLFNSSTLGSRLGQLDYDQALRRQAIDYNAMQQRDAMAQNAYSNAYNTIGGLADLTGGQAAMSNQGLNAAYSGAQNVSMANAAAQNQANNLAWQQQLQQSQQSRIGGETWGQLAGGGIALGLAPFTGGASLAYFAPAMAAGGQVGGMFGGGNVSDGSNMAATGVK
jgi:hypothetical protein